MFVVSLQSISFAWIKKEYSEDKISQLVDNSIPTSYMKGPSFDS